MNGCSDESNEKDGETSSETIIIISGTLELDNICVYGPNGGDKKYQKINSYSNVWRGEIVANAENKVKVKAQNHTTNFKI